MLTLKNAWKKIVLSIAFCMYSMNALAQELPRINMYRGVTPLSQDIYDLHMTIFWICVVIGILVFSAMGYALYYHRKSRGVEAAQFEGHHRLEIVWATIPLIILIIMAIPATIVIRDMHNFQDSDLTIKITGYQWKWEYEYLDQGIKYFSNLSTPLSQINNKETKNKWYLLEVDKPIVVPTQKKIRFLITSNDVIHSWWVPELGIKKDAIPGFIHEAWAEIETPGTYRGQCAELCGVNHGFMPIVVIAKPQAEFDKWVAEQKPKKAEAGATYTLNDLMTMGRNAYNKYCAACHQENGKGIDPIYPALQADSVAVGGTIERHIDIVLNGVPGTAMQAFKSQLTDVEIAAIVTYERNAWGNNTGDVVQPADIEKQRAGILSPTAAPKPGAVNQSAQPTPPPPANQQPAATPATNQQPTTKPATTPTNQTAPVTTPTPPASATPLQPPARGESP